MMNDYRHRLACEYSIYVHTSVLSAYVTACTFVFVNVSFCVYTFIFAHSTICHLLLGTKMLLLMTDGLTFITVLINDCILACYYCVD